MVMVSIVKILTNAKRIHAALMLNVLISPDHSNATVMKVIWVMVFNVKISTNVGQIHATPMLLVQTQRDLSVVLVTLVTMVMDSYVLMLTNVYPQNHAQSMPVVRIDQVLTRALVFKVLVEMEKLAKT